MREDMHAGGVVEKIKCDKKQRWLASERDSTRRVFWGAGVEGIKMARTDLCLHRAGREGYEGGCPKTH